MKTEHILIIRFSAIGDVTMTVPVVSSIARQYPHVRITVLSRPFARPLFENIAPNVGFMGADIKGEYRGIQGLNALYRRLSAKHFTAIADLHDTLRSKYLRMRFNLNFDRVEHINKHKHGRRRLTQQHNKQLQQQPTAFENYADVFHRLGYPIRVEFTPNTSNLQDLLGQLPDSIGQHHGTEPWIGIAPFAAHKGKVYPPELMEKVIRLLTEQRPQCRIFFFGGGKAEKEQLDDWTRQFRQAANASAMLGSISSELALMSQLDVMLTMDSANMHLASLAGTNVVSVWGATHPYAGFMGWGQKMENTVQAQLSCRPCSVYGKKPCHRGDFACMTLIQPEEISQKVLSVAEYHNK